VIAATNRDLQAAISAGPSVVICFIGCCLPIEIPSLRERSDDIPLLVNTSSIATREKLARTLKRVNKKTLELLQSYPCRNIRELQNVVERSVYFANGDFLDRRKWLPQPPPLTLESKQQVELPRRLLVEEKEMIEAALKETGGRGLAQGSRGQVGHPAVYAGIEDSVVRDQQESLQDLMLNPSKTEIDRVGPARSRAHRNIVSAVSVLCDDRMPLFIKNFSSDAYFQQGPVAEQESPYKTDMSERDYKTDILEGRAQGLEPGSESCCTQRQMDDGRVPATGTPFTNIETDGRWKLQPTWNTISALLLIQPTIRLNKLNRCRSSATAWCAGSR